MSMIAVLLSELPIIPVLSQVWPIHDSKWQIEYTHHSYLNKNESLKTIFSSPFFVSSPLTRWFRQISRKLAESGKLFLGEQIRDEVSVD